MTDSQGNGYQPNQRREAAFCQSAANEVKKKFFFSLSFFSFQKRRQKEERGRGMHRRRLFSILSHPVNHTRRMTEDKNVRWIIKFGCSIDCCLLAVFGFFSSSLSSVFVDPLVYGRNSTVPVRFLSTGNQKNSFHLQPSSASAVCVGYANPHRVCVIQ